MRLAIYNIRGKRERIVANALYAGARRIGWKPTIYAAYTKPEADICTAYGWINENIFAKYNQYIYWDLGYWGRGQMGYYRYSVNDWDTAKHMVRNNPLDRLDTFPEQIVRTRAPVGPDAPVLIAAMSAKGAGTHGHGFNAWEIHAKLRLKELTRRPVIVRPKTAVRTGRITTALQSAHMLVAHHSNAVLEAMAADVPFHVVKGIGLLGSTKLTAVETPRILSYDLRRQMIADAAYAQWSVEEMESGVALDFIRSML